jgi:uncharacterized membrane protein YphA (DoxX/SURF4 family)
LAGFLSHVAAADAFGWYDRFLTAIVIPNVRVFAILIVAGELLVAASMLSGIGTRATAVLAILLLANYACAKGMPPWSPASNDTADIVLALIVFATPSSLAPLFKNGIFNRSLKNSGLGRSSSSIR